MTEHKLTLDADGDPFGVLLPSELVAGSSRVFVSQQLTAFDGALEPVIPFAVDDATADVGGFTIVDNAIVIPADGTYFVTLVLTFPDDVQHASTRLKTNLVTSQAHGVLPGLAVVEGACVGVHSSGLPLCLDAGDKVGARLWTANATTVAVSIEVTRLGPLP